MVPIYAGNRESVLFGQLLLKIQQLGVTFCALHRVYRLAWWGDWVYRLAWWFAKTQSRFIVAAKRISCLKSVREINIQQILARPFCQSSKVLGQKSKVSKKIFHEAEIKINGPDSCLLSSLILFKLDSLRQTMLSSSLSKVDLILTKLCTTQHLIEKKAWRSKLRPWSHF